MHFIVMGVIGKLNLLPQGHQYVPTVIDMLMNYTWCVKLNTEEADELVHTYLVNIY